MKQSTGSATNVPSVTASSATQVVGIIASTGCIETIIANITKGKEEDTYKDLAQDLYLSLLKDKTTVEAYNEGHIQFYVTRLVLNNVISSTSSYYRTYRKPLKKFASLDEGDLLKILSNREDIN